MSSIPTPKRAGISRIPPEILGEIFIRCLPIDSASQSTQQLLSSVCRLWRALALATPALWASLDIIYDIDILRPPLPVIQTHLQRSGTHPLSFDLHTTDREYFLIDNPHFLAALTTLTAARQRWRNVKIDLDRMTRDVLDLITQGDAPLLRSMRCDIMEFPQSLPVPLHMLHYCPRLEIFHWNSFESPLLLPLVTTKLTSLSLQASLSVSECITLLRLSPRLFSVEFYGLQSPDPPAAPHLTHLKLCILSAAGEHSPALLAALTLPALLELELRVGYTGWDIGLPEFLARSNPTLHQLSLLITSAQNVEPALLRVLALTPHLCSLRLSNCRPDSPPFTAALIHALDPRSSPGAPLCPRLQDLEVSGISDCPDGLCSAMLRARWGACANANGVARLEWGTIELKSGMHDRDEADMKELRAEGSQVTLHLRD